MKRNIINECKLVFPALSRNESLSRSAAAAFALQCDPEAAEIAAIKTAVSEAVTNAIVHGYRDSEGNIEMVFRLYEDSVIYISVKEKVGSQRIKNRHKGTAPHGKFGRVLGTVSPSSSHHAGNEARAAHAEEVGNGRKEHECRHTDRHGGDHLIIAGQSDKESVGHIVNDQNNLSHHRG